MYRFLPPPVVLVLIAIAMWLTGLYPGWTLPAMPGQAPIAALIAVAGLLLMVWAALCFRRASTTINPMRPTQASELVATGPYRFSRNPMYLGDALLLLAWAVYLGTTVNVVWVTRERCSGSGGRLGLRLRLRVSTGQYRIALDPGAQPAGGYACAPESARALSRPATSWPRFATRK